MVWRSACPLSGAKRTWRTVGEDVTLMAAAAGTDDLGSDHPVAGVTDVVKMLLGEGKVKLGQPVPL